MEFRLELLSVLGVLCITWSSVHAQSTTLSQPMTERRRQDIEGIMRQMRRAFPFERILHPPVTPNRVDAIGKTTETTPVSFTENHKNSNSHIPPKLSRSGVVPANTKANSLSARRKSLLLALLNGNNVRTGGAYRHKAPIGSAFRGFRTYQEIPYIPSSINNEIQTPSENILGATPPMSLMSSDQSLRGVERFNLASPPTNESHALKEKFRNIPLPAKLLPSLHNNRYLSLSQRIRLANRGALPFLPRDLVPVVIRERLDRQTQHELRLPESTSDPIPTMLREPASLSPRVTAQKVSLGSRLGPETATPQRPKEHPSPVADLFNMDFFNSFDVAPNPQLTRNTATKNFDATSAAGNPAAVINAPTNFDRARNSASSVGTSINFDALSPSNGQVTSSWSQTPQNGARPRNTLLNDRDRFRPGSLDITTTASTKSVSPSAVRQDTFLDPAYPLDGLFGPLASFLGSHDVVFQPASSISVNNANLPADTINYSPFPFLYPYFFDYGSISLPFMSQY